MRSLYAKILLWCLATLLLSLTAFFYINTRVFSPQRRGMGFMRSFAAFQMEEAAEAYTKGGKSALAAYVERADRILRGTHHLTDEHGVDLLTGEDLSARIHDREDRPPPFPKGNRPMQIARRTPNGKHHWIVVMPPPAGDPAEFIPYYLVVLAAVVLLLLLLASRIVAPLRALAVVMDRFGRGELDARFPSRRKDEIGNVGRAFNDMAERLETLLVAERRLLQDVSHELRSPLARLSFAARLARTAPDRDAAIDRIKHEVDRLTELVSSLIEVTRAEGDPSERARNSIDLDALLEKTIEACRLDAQARKCSVVYRGKPGVAVLGNEELLRRAVENVTRNAIRYAPPESEVEVSLEATEREAVVRVRDSGPGVPEEQLSRIFDPFFRVENSRDAKQGGVGLGLAIARRAVAVHSGTLSAENAGPGLRVTMRLPLP